MRPLTTRAAHARSSDPRRAWAARVQEGRQPSIHCEQDADVSRLYLYDPIDDWFGITPSDFRAALDPIEGDVELHINCPGGDAFDGIAILNMLRQHDGNVTAVVDGLAASAASFIAAGVDELVMAPNSELMIHDAWGICIGPASEMDKMGDMLDQISDSIAGIYADKATGSADAWRDLMRAETWYVDEEAVSAGLADSLLDGAAPEDLRRTAASSGGQTGRIAARRRRNGPPSLDEFDQSMIPTTIAAAISG